MNIHVSLLIFMCVSSLHMCVHFFWEWWGHRACRSATEDKVKLSQSVSTFLAVLQFSVFNVFLIIAI